MLEADLHKTGVDEEEVLIDEQPRAAEAWLPGRPAVRNTKTLPAKTKTTRAKASLTKAAEEQAR